MNSIFDKLYTNENGNPAPLPPLQEAMQYQYEVKQTNTIDGSTVLPYDQMNAEMFYPLQLRAQRCSKYVHGCAMLGLGVTSLNPALFRISSAAGAICGD